MILSAILMMQFVVSAKAGLVNQVDGSANVRLHTQVAAGLPIQTGAQSHLELLLNPGSFLRIGENSTVVLDSVELANIAVRIVSGSALIETASVDREFPIRVTTGRMHTSIISPGLYRFSGDWASVLDGKLRADGFAATVKKGHELTLIGDSFEEIKVPQNAVADDLDTWSRQRSSDLAHANTLVYRDRSSAFYSNSFYSTWGLFSTSAAWIYSPFLGGFTFLPYSGYRSPYGYSFVPMPVFGFQPGGAGTVRTASTSRTGFSQPASGTNMSGIADHSGGGSMHSPVQSPAGHPIGGGGGGGAVSGGAQGGRSGGAGSHRP